jgi:chromosome segregation ATPase
MVGLANHKRRKTMTMQHDIFNALKDAMIAYEDNPRLYNKIADLEQELELYRAVELSMKVEIEGLKERITAQNERIAEFQDEVMALTVEKSNLKATLEDTEKALRQEGFRNAELDVEVEQKDTLISILRSDKASLERQISDKSTLLDRASATLKRIMGEAAGVVEGNPAPEVVAPQPFPVPVESSLGNDSASGSVSVEASPNDLGPVVSPDPVVEPVKINQDYWHQY